MGGRFNPIVIVDREPDATLIVELFRPDIILPVGDSDEVQTFAKKFPHLINPFHQDELFVGSGSEDTRAHVLDIQNTLQYLHHRPEWKEWKDRGFRLYRWEEYDALADIFLMQFGSYPHDVEINYWKMVKESTDAQEYDLHDGDELPSDIFDHPTIASFSRYGLERHYSSHFSGHRPGFFLGDSNNLDDLVACWNLRAGDESLWFVDLNHIDRYKAIVPNFRKLARALLSYRSAEGGSAGIAIWSREGSPVDVDTEAIKVSLGDGPWLYCTAGSASWNGLNIQPPMMHLGEVNTLGVLTKAASGKPKVSFGFTEKPYSGDIWFGTQHLVASLSFGAGFRDDATDYTLAPPFVPELNEYCARAMLFGYANLRLESQRIAVIIDAFDTDETIYPLPVAPLIEKIFDLVGFESKLSSGGLITRQLINQLGGVSGAIVFKIPGVRRLLKTYRPTTAFTKKSAVQLIGAKEPGKNGSSFADHEYLHLGPRPPRTKLRAPDVFSHLVEKGLFRVGAELICTNCQMPSWTSLEQLRQKIDCEMCGQQFDATKQLVNEEWHYRRSGVLGAERNAQGAVAVAMTLQQLDTNLDSAYLLSPSLELTRKNGGKEPFCEVDFVWIVARPFPKKTTVILAECKDEGLASARSGDGGTINQKDIESLKAVADAFPTDRFDTFVLLAKLCPFTAQEIELAKSLNGPYRRRAILLSDRELEPYQLYDRTALLFNIAARVREAEDLALATESIFFNPQPK